MKKLIAFFLILIILLIAVTFKINSNLIKPDQDISKVALAEDDDDDDDEDEEKNEGKEKSKEEKSNSKPIIEIMPVYKTIITYDPGYGQDTDGDKLVDAIDPNPTVIESEFFTDDDKDGVPNAFDEHKGEDDFKYKVDSDSNNNGVLDSYEEL